MKTFYSVHHITANFDDHDSVRGYTTHIVAVESTLFDAMQHFTEDDQDYDSSYSIRRFVEYYELNPSTNAYEPVTEERPVIYSPTIEPKPEVDPWATAPF
jgi:hypothetical protein